MRSHPFSHFCTNFAVPTRGTHSTQKRRHGSASILAAATLAAALLGRPTPAQAQDFLGSAAQFAVLGGSTVTNTGTTTLRGSVGVSPGTAMTGFASASMTGGAMYSGGAIAAQAQTDAAAAYTTLAGLTVTTDLSGQDLGSLVLTPGVYRFATTADLTGALVLNAQGDANARFVFQIGSTLTTATGSSVALVNGGNANRIYWQVGTSATLGASSAFEGNLLALTSITANAGANIDTGRLLARDGAVTLSSNRVITPAETGAPEPGSLILLGMGLVSGMGGMGAARRRRERH